MAWWLPASGAGLDFPRVGGCCVLLASGHRSRRFDHLDVHGVLIKPSHAFPVGGKGEDVPEPNRKLGTYYS